MFRTHSYSTREKGCVGNKWVNVNNPICFLTFVFYLIYSGSWEYYVWTMWDIDASFLLFLCWFLFLRKILLYGIRQILRLFHEIKIPEFIIQIDVFAFILVNQLTFQSYVFDFYMRRTDTFQGYEKKWCNKGWTNIKNMITGLCINQFSSY